MDIERKGGAVHLTMESGNVLSVGADLDPLATNTVRLVCKNLVSLTVTHLTSAEALAFAAEITRAATTAKRRDTLRRTMNARQQARSVAAKAPAIDRLEN